MAFTLDSAHWPTRELLGSLRLGATLEFVYKTCLFIMIIQKTDHQRLSQNRVKQKIRLVIMRNW